MPSDNNSSPKITLKEFAESVRGDPNSLLDRIHKAGLTKYTIDSQLDYKDKEKIVQALSGPKQKLKRKTLDKNAHKGKYPTRQAATGRTGKTFSSADSAGKGREQRHSDRKFTGSAGNRGTREGSARGGAGTRGGASTRGGAVRSADKKGYPGRGGKGEQRGGASARRPSGPGTGTGRGGHKFSKGPVLKSPPKSFAKPDASPASQSQSPAAKEKKNKRTRSEEVQNIIDKSVQRYGIRITSDDIAEIEEIMHKQDKPGGPDIKQVIQPPVKPKGTKISAKHGFIKPTVQQQKEVRLAENITLSDLAAQLAVKADSIKERIRKNGIEVTGEEQLLDRDTATLLIEELGHKAILSEDNASERPDDSPPAGAKMVSRPPVVTVMGHVDHGKTTLLDYLRKTKQAEEEAGNITQHLGAYTVTLNKQNITFMDTPGHAAFSAMRARGAGVTDIVVLVVAADEGIKPQTEEAIKHATVAKRTLVVALNKMDKPGVDTEQIRKELSARGLKSEEWGGDVQFVEISAKEGTNIDKLLESILVQAEVMDLKAAPDVPARGRVLESRLDKNMGAVATLLVRHGTLKQGDIIGCGHCYGRIKIMRDHNGRAIRQASPSEPAEIFGLSGVPQAGDVFLVCENEKEARKLAEANADLDKERAEPVSREVDAEAFMKEKQTHITKVNLIIKTDVSGSLEAIASLVDSIIADTEEDKNLSEITVISKGAGAISVTDVSLAEATDALILGFNVRPDAPAKKLIKQHNLDERVQYFSVIYELGNELQRFVKEKSMLRGTEKILGIAEVKEVFRAKTYGQIAGCMVTEGSIMKEKPIRVLRENKVIYEGVLESLRRFKEDVKEVQKEVECGIGVKDYKDVRVGDQIEVYDRNLPSGVS